jgi:hypothetical protein
MRNIPGPTGKKIVTIPSKKTKLPKTNLHLLLKNFSGSLNFIYPRKRENKLALFFLQDKKRQLWISAHD